VSRGEGSGLLVEEEESVVNRSRRSRHKTEGSVPNKTYEPVHVEVKPRIELFIEM